MNYIYPDDLKGSPMLFLWRLKDLVKIGIGAIIAGVALAETCFTIPLVITISYAFLAIRFDYTSILDFLRYAINYFFIEQQEYRWQMRKGGE